jgi:hypothetical protein
MGEKFRFRAPCLNLVNAFQIGSNALYLKSDFSFTSESV